MSEYPTTLITMKILQSLSFGELFSFWKGVGGGFADKHVAAKVFRQHMFSIQYLIPEIIILEIKKI